MRFHLARVRYRRRYLLVPILVMMIVPMVMVWSNTLTGTSAASSNRDGSLPSPYCHKGDPLAGIYNPLRFRVLSGCEVASGVVKSISSEPDGGLWIFVKVDARYSKLVGPGNISGQNGLLILEQGAGDSAVFSLIGERISFVGPLVYDTVNQFNAICPIWSINS